jgi:uncharacterized protein YrrD
MTSFAALKGRAVIAHDTAERIGTVEGLVVDPGAHRILALHVGGKKSSGEFVSWGDVASIGDDAVMTSTSSTRPAAGDVEERVAHGVSLELGMRTLADVGDVLGDLDDVSFDADSGSIESLRVADRTISGDHLLGIGSYAVVVRQDES